MRLFFLFLLSIPAWSFAAPKDSIGEVPLKYEVLAKGANTDDYLWIAGDRKYNVYYKDSNFIVERKMKGILWLIRGHSFAPYRNEEIYIDSVYFQNISENPEKELMIRYSLFSLRPTGANTKSKHLMIVDLTEQKIVLNVALYDFKISPDENGKVIDYLYEADVEVSHNQIKVVAAEDSDIDNPAIQLSDGIYHRRGHCFTKH